MCSVPQTLQWVIYHICLTLYMQPEQEWFVPFLDTEDNEDTEDTADTMPTGIKRPLEILRPLEVLRTLGY